MSTKRFPCGNFGFCQKGSKGSQSCGFSIVYIKKSPPNQRANVCWRAKTIQLLVAGANHIIAKLGLDQVGRVIYITHPHVLA
jgi:hypothetical protein